MGLIELFILAVGLSMDAFAVSVCKGLAMPKITVKKTLIVGLWFGGFQALMPAIGYLLGVQFRAILENDLYLENARHANALAQHLQAGIEALGYSMLLPSPTNQIFPIFPNDLLERLCSLYEYEVQQPMDEQSTCIRLVTSWATPPEAVEQFLDDLARLRAI